MAYNLGKAFEEQFKKDWIKTMPNSSIDRIYDTVNGYYGISNISDFIAYKMPNIFYIECKEHKGASIPFENITQYERLKKKVGIPGVRAGVLLWLSEKDVGVIYIPISTITKMKEDGLKSFGIRHLDDPKYFSVRCPGEKKRLFYSTDYSILLTLKDGE